MHRQLLSLHQSATEHPFLYPQKSALYWNANEANPFVDGRRIDQAFITGNGETILLTDQYDRAEYLRLNFEAPPPETQAHIAAAAADRAELVFESSILPPRWFRWRLDGGAWSEPTADTRMTLDGLPGGKHRCEVVALDRWLRTDPTPSGVSLTVTVSESERLARLMTDLGSTDFETREAAVRALARYPEKALPALRAARTSATENIGWWIDAAIQEAERASQVVGKQ